jgi:hypothetical protein
VSVLNALNQAYQNYARILVLVTQAVANPTGANIDAVTQAAETSGIVTPKPSYTKDGQNILWMEYQQFILTSMVDLEKAIQRATGPIQISTRYYSG